MATRTITTKHVFPVYKLSPLISDASHTGPLVGDTFSLKGKSNVKFLMQAERNANGHYEIQLVCTQFGRKQSMQLRVKIWDQELDSLVDDETKFKRCLSIDKIGNVCLYATWASHTMTMYVIANKLTIHCEIQNEKPIDGGDSGGDAYELVDRNEFGQNMLNLHSDGYFDLTIRVQGKEFKANKIILMGYSSVFKSMLSAPNSIEAKSSIIEIENMKAEVIDAMIRWIYQAKIENMNEIALDLYRAADKYDIGCLKKVCAKAMANRLSPINVLARIILAYDHNEEELKQHVLDFIADDIQRAQSLMTSDEWMEYCGKHPDEAKQIVADVFKRFY